MPYTQTKVLISLLHSYLQFQGLLRHGKRTIERLVSSDEASSVDKDTTWNTRDLVELFITNTLPCIWKILAVLEAAILLADGTNTPLALGLVFREKDI